MRDEMLRIFRRLVRQAQIELAAETIPVRRVELEKVLVLRRLELERYQREPALVRQVQSSRQDQARVT
jgi:hypothetical protein